MVNKELLSYIKNELNPDELKDSSFLAYNSLIEEAIKLAILASDSAKTIVVIKENAYSANYLYEILRSFYNDEELVLYNPEESLRAEAIASSFENRASRINALYSLLTLKPKILITTAYGIIRHLPNVEYLKDRIIKIKLNDIIERDDLILKLKDVGYQRVPTCENPLTYAIRGSIIDIFSTNYTNPLRIEFFDDEIDSIRFYDVNSQMTLENIKECQISFASDVLFTDEQIHVLKDKLEGFDSVFDIDIDFIENHIYQGNLYYYYAYLKDQSHLLDYIQDFTIYLSDAQRNIDHLKLLSEETFAYIREMAETTKLPIRFYVFEDYHHELDKYKVLNASPYSQAIPLITEVFTPGGSLDLILKTISKDLDKNIVLVVNEDEIEEVINSLNNLDYKYNVITDNIKPGFNILCDNLNEGFEIKDIDLIVYGSKEIFNHKKLIGKYARKYEESIKLNSYEELKRGDYIVHNQYGIGQYVGIEKRVVNNITMDYLKILYRGNDELLVPLSKFSLVRKYVSKDGVIPKLHKLGSKEWSKTKKRVEEGVDDLAERLVSLYAKRNENIGFSFSKDNDIQKAFEKEFIYELTSDQKRSIDEIKKDMEDTKPMDRLLCGDVGFGKTEVAIRASMKAVLDKKQVAYLCPTTVLSLQHYKTFKKRFANYPVRVEVLNRYISLSDQKKIIEDIKKGLVDIVIGTHRILSKDIVFNDLGLLIIDEEQRFGVEHKEKITELKESIDVLSLSATPIPRTLQMSLVGLRGLSTLDTPPKNRYPIQTYVVEKNESLIKEVIERELIRNGQVFYLFNDIDHIYSVASKLEKSIKGVSIIVAHGKMSREELEDAMKNFYDNKANILLCTTIIETGIDIPNTNTIIIDNAQNFGLAQLYQIRGRVGRSDRIAYAYLMIPPKKELTEVANKRLKAIKEFTALGSGYKIAMRDLAIRGAGDMLGNKQSGFIDNVGLDLYLMMLEKAIKKKKGEEVKEDIEINKPLLPIDSYIPDSFTDNDYDKLDLYHRLDSIVSKEELLNYYLEVKDKYGKLPKEIDALFNKKQIELFIDGKVVESFKILNARMVLTLTKEFSDTIDGMKLFEYCANLSKDLKIRYIKEKIEFSFQNRKEEMKKLINLLENLKGVTK